MEWWLWWCVAGAVCVCVEGRLGERGDVVVVVVLAVAVLGCGGVARRRRCCGGGTAVVARRWRVGGVVVCGDGGAVVVGGVEVAMVSPLSAACVGVWASPRTCVVCTRMWLL